MLKVLSINDWLKHHARLGSPTLRVRTSLLSNPQTTHLPACSPACLLNLLFSEKFAPRTGSLLHFRRSLRLVFTLSRTDSRSSGCEQGRPGWLDGIGLSSGRRYQAIDPRICLRRGWEQGSTVIKEITYRCTAYGSIGVHTPLSPPFIAHSSFLVTMLPPGTRGTALAATRETFDKSNKDAIARRRTILMFRRRFPIHFIHGTGITRRSWRLYRIMRASRENHNILCILRTQDPIPRNVFGVD